MRSYDETAWTEPAEWSRVNIRGGPVSSGFRRLQRVRSPGNSNVQPAATGLQSLVARHVIERFARMGDAALTVVALNHPDATEDPPANPGHPACSQYADSDYCRESWQLHLAAINRRPETHWHKCDHGLFCAIVPIVHHDQCLAAVKLACPASMAEDHFVRQVELLDVLAREFVASNPEYLERLSEAQAARAEQRACATENTGAYVERRPTHARILKAIENIESHLADPKLTVASVATRLGMDPSYLGHLFVDQVGQRMSRFISARRIELAKNLLATTDWQIKRIAHETGHANANWFCYIFRTFTGLTPGAYRRGSHDPSRSGARR